MNSKEQVKRDIQDEARALKLAEGFCEMLGPLTSGHHDQRYIKGMVLTAIKQDLSPDKPLITDEEIDFLTNINADPLSPEFHERFKHTIALFHELI